jgi:BirA family biotin operon repressor/biotin-[acetyl-CoA-carboxylase] ligase
MIQLAPFDLGAVEQSIAGTEFAGHLLHLLSVASTNDLALQAAQGGARHGVWIADEQTAGRGRGNHRWHSSPGDGLYLTALISPPIPMQSALRLSLVTAIAAQAAISLVTGLRCRDQIDIRWPNDLLINREDGTSRKCGGILIETAAQPVPEVGTAMLRYAVVGIGINCNHTSFPPELDAIATSLRREISNRNLPGCTAPLRRETLAAAILIALDQEMRLLIRGGQDVNYCHRRDLSEYSSWISGKRVCIEEDGGYTGVTAGLDPDGFLRIAGDDGVLHTVRSGGVRAK